MNKTTKYISLWAAISGLLFELIALIPMTPTGVVKSIIQYAFFLSPNVGLSFMENRLFTYSSFDSPFNLNYLEVAFYLILLTGAFLYSRSKGLEKRLIGFVFSIILIAKILGVVSLVFSLVKYWSHIQSDSVLNFILAFAFNALWLIFSFRIVRAVVADQTILKTPHHRDESLVVYHPSRRLQRLIHHLIDLILCFLLFSGFFMFLFREQLRDIAPLLGERGTIYLMLFLARLTYLPLFEGVFGMTPAKFLTSSMVINLDGSKINWGTAFARSISRHVPFEAFSFLGSNGGWHDKWTGTQVVNTQNTSFSAGRFLWFFPAFVAIGLLTFLGHELWDDYKRFLFSKNQHKIKIDQIYLDIDNLTDKDMIMLEDVHRQYASDAFYLKIESVNGETIEASVLWIENSYRYQNMELEQAYLKQRAFLDKLIISKEQLLQAFTADYSDYDDGKRKGVDLLNDGKRYEIEKIYHLYAPAIVSSSRGSAGNGRFSLGMENFGWPCDIVSIDNLEGDMQWENELPQRVNTNYYSSYDSFSLTAYGIEYGSPYKFTFTVQDTIGRKHIYLVEGVKLDRTVSLLQTTSVGKKH